MMRSRNILILFVTVFLALPSFAQIGGRAEKLIGKWEFKEGSGFETWRAEGDELVGKAYRKGKVGDTTKVEEVNLKRVNKNLIYTLNTYNIVQDSVIVNTYRFVGGKRKLSFVNIDSNTPYSIDYKFGFLNRNKLFIKIKYGINDKATKLTLRRVTD